MLGQPQEAQGAQEMGGEGGAEQAPPRQHQLLQVEVKGEAAELLRGERQPGQQLLVQHLQQAGAAQQGPWGPC